MTQEQLAKKADVALRSIVKWEKGEGEPHPENIRAISKALDIPFERFWEESNAKVITSGNLRDAGSNYTTAADDAELWKRRALTAEQKLQSLRAGLKSLYDMSSGSPMPRETEISSESHETIEEHVEDAYDERQKKGDHRPRS